MVKIQRKPPIYSDISYVSTVLTGTGIREVFSGNNNAKHASGRWRCDVSAKTETSEQNDVVVVVMG